jgi:Delta7-sterol 5-desaturase
MDLVLEICDHYAFDTIWAHLVPLSPASSDSLQAAGSIVNASAAPKVAGGLALSKWADVFSFLPTDMSSSPAFTPSPLISAWPRDYVPRQLLSLILLTLVGIHVLYFLFAGVSYKYIFDHNMMRHPRFLKNQVKLEIQSSLRSFPGMTMLTLPWFQAEVMGYSKLYKNVDEYGWFYLVASVPL